MLNEITSLRLHLIKTSPEHLPILDALVEVYDDFRKCSDEAQRLDAMNPGTPGAFTGTVSERLKRQVDTIIGVL